MAGVRFLPIDGPAPLARLQLVSNRASQARTLQNFLARVGAQGAIEA